MKICLHSYTVPFKTKLYLGGAGVAMIDHDQSWDFHVIIDHKVNILTFVLLLQIVFFFSNKVIVHYSTYYYDVLSLLFIFRLTFDINHGDHRHVYVEILAVDTSS